MMKHIFIIFQRIYDYYFFQDITKNTLQTLSWYLLEKFLFIIGPVFLAAMIAALLSNILQVGFMSTTETLKMKLERIDPISGFKRIFSPKALVEMLKSILKVTFVGAIAINFLSTNLGSILGLIFKSPGATLGTISSVTVKLGLFTGLGLLFLALLDYLYQKYEFEKVSMSKQDIKMNLKIQKGTLR